MRKQGMWTIHIIWYSSKRKKEEPSRIRLLR